MIIRRPPRGNFSGLPARILAELLLVALAAGLLAGLATTPATAQGYGWFGNLFGGPPVSQQPSYPGYDRPYRSAPREVYRRASPIPRRAVRHRTSEPPVSAPPKEQAERAPPKNASVYVHVYGDSLGLLLANGLDDALSDRQDVAVIHKARGATGLIANDVYDWPKAIEGLSVAPSKHAQAKSDKSDQKGSWDDQANGGKPEKIDVAVMMIGSNDRQPIREDGKTLEFGSDAWTAAYRKRVVAIDEAFRRKGVPLVWVGVPITKNDDFADAMATLNEIYRTAAAQTGAVYVDTWEAFSDDNGDFSAFGPDINGQTVRLRAADGIHFTRAGARKLAHFVEAHIRRALDGKTPPAELPTQVQPDVADVPAVDKPTVAAVKPDAGPIKNLNEAPAASNGQLAAANAFRVLPNSDPLLETTLVKGLAQVVPAGRADDLRWPPGGLPK